MSIKIMSEVWDHAPVKNATLLFLLALADAANDEDRCAWPGGKALQQKVRCSERSIYNHAEELQKAGIITALEGDDRPARYSRQPGRETTCWRIEPSENWRGAEVAGVQEVAPQASNPLHPTPAAACTRTTTTPKRTEPGTTRAALRRRGEQEQEFAAGELPEDEPAPVEIRAPRRQTPTSLATYFRRWAQASYPMWPESSGEKPLARNISTWTKNGVDTELVAQAMELFMDDTRWHRAGTPLWKSFVANFTTLATRVRGGAPLPPAQEVTRIKQTEEKKTWESYEEWEQEQLRRAGRA